MENPKNNIDLLKQRFDEIDDTFFKSTIEELSYFQYSKAVLAYEYGDEFVNNPNNASIITQYSQTIAIHQKLSLQHEVLQEILEKLNKISK